jgi:hypothetical protein
VPDKRRSAFALAAVSRKRATNLSKQPVASTPQEVGHVPIFDHMRTSRAAVAWSRDSRKLWVLWVKEPDSEGGSAVAMRRGLPVGGGWTVPDLQRFWLSMKSQGVFNAINSDAVMFCKPPCGAAMATTT